MPQKSELPHKDEPPARALADAAYTAIEEQIVNRHLLPGSMISENQLSEELGMGRTPIREALQRLRHIGFVEVHPRRGAVVSGVDVVRQLELLEVRAPLEELAVRCAALRASPMERSELSALAREMMDAARRKDASNYFRANKLIHEREVWAAHNQVLISTMHMIHAQSRRFWYAYIEQTNGFIEGARLHGEVIGAITQRDAELAANSAANLIKFLAKLTQDVIARNIT